MRRARFNVAGHPNTMQRCTHKNPQDWGRCCLSLAHPGEHRFRWGDTDPDGPPDDEPATPPTSSQDARGAAPAPEPSDEQGTHYAAGERARAELERFASTGAEDEIQDCGPLIRWAIVGVCSRSGDISGDLVRLRDAVIPPSHVIRQEPLP